MEYSNLEKAAAINEIKNLTKKLIRQLMSSIDVYGLDSIEIKTKIKQSISDSFAEIETDLQKQIENY